MAKSDILFKLKTGKNMSLMFGRTWRKWAM